MKIAICLAAAALLAGCANDRIVNGNASAVMIQRDSVAGAAALAQKHCAAYGKDSRLAHSEGFVMSFDCVKH